MNYVKKMCVLRQIKQGFSADGKPLTGLIKAEQYGKNLAVEVSVMNFAPLSSGEYFCLLSDGKGNTEMLALRGKSIFNLLTDMDISEGFCGVICLVKNEVTPIAYGVTGNKVYDWRAILNATLPPVFPQNEDKITPAQIPNTETKIPLSAQPQTELNPTQPQPEEEPQVLPHTPNAREDKTYNDDCVAEENYYEVKENERQLLEETIENAYASGASEKPREEERANSAKNGDAPRVLHPFAVN
ncbi:MAG: hypothetical protein IIX02_06515, partial [Clostridia bacterium]|nr:hypothetical protein [Clostridia bacterium]